MKIIAIAAQKGGTGKTTTALNIAGGLSLAGFKVLLIDLDYQRNATLSTGAKVEGVATVYDVLMDHAFISDAVQSCSPFDVVAASDMLTTYDRRNDFGNLGRALSTLRGYDYTIIDTPPALGAVSLTALIAADLAIIPADCSAVWSVQMLIDMGRTLHAIRHVQGHQFAARVLLTRYKPRAASNARMIPAIGAAAEQIGANVYASRIRECSAIVKAQLKGIDVFRASPRSNAAADYAALVAEIVKGE